MSTDVALNETVVAAPAPAREATAPSVSSLPETVIRPRRGWLAIDLKELWAYRELLYFLTWRDIKVRYKQTVLGALWAIIQPTLNMVVFTLFFGRLAKMPSDGVPYPIFVYAGLLPWTYFSHAVTQAGDSLIGSQNLITKVYFPRPLIPMGAATAGLVDFVIALTVLGGLMAYYGFVPSIGLMLFPVLALLTYILAIGVGLWLSASNVKYRDIRYAIPFLIQLWMFCTPVIYPTTLLKKYAWIMALNPMGGLIEAFRACTLGHRPIPWSSLSISCIIVFAVFMGGLIYFRRTERYFADVI